MPLKFSISAAYNFLDTVQTGTFEAIRALLKKMTIKQKLEFLSYKDIYRGTALSIATYQDDSRRIQALWEGLSAEQRMDLLEEGDIYNNRTPLMNSAAEGYTDCIATLLAGLNREQRQHLFGQEDEDGLTAIEIAHDAGEDETVDILERLGARFPDGLERELDLINGSESTGTSSVCDSLARSAIVLAARYLEDISIQDKTTLNLWAKGKATDQKEAENQNAMQMVMRKLTTEAAIARLTAQYAPIIEKWAKNLKESTVQKRIIAKSIDRINKMTCFQNHRTYLGLAQVLTLVWVGLNDTAVFKQRGDTPAQLENKLQDRYSLLAQHLIEAQTAHGTNNPACPNGTFNKIISTLAGGLHPDVHMIFVNDLSIKAKAMALVAEQFDVADYTKTELIALKKSEDFTLFFQLTSAVEDKLKRKIKPALDQEFEGMLHSVAIDRACDSALSLLDAKAIEVIMQRLADHQEKPKPKLKSKPITVLHSYPTRHKLKRGHDEMAEVASQETSRKRLRIR